jgi:hypothetical protein
MTKGRGAKVTERDVRGGLKPLLPAAMVARFLTKHGITVEQIAEGRPCWKMPDGLKPLTIGDVETLIAVADPVAWMRLNLIEPRDVLNADTGEVAIVKGSPWVLAPVQERMARISRNALFECGAETGKTRNIIGRSLWLCDTRPGSKVLIACANQTVAEEIAVAADWQADQNGKIAQGKRRKLAKSPFYALTFENDSEIQLRLVGAAGEQLRGFHGTALFGDECALWRSLKCFTELYRAGESGAVVQLFSTHNGDRASAWYGIVSRARPLDKREGERFDDTVAGELEPGFVKMRISKLDLPPPLWGPARKREAVALYNGEGSSEYRQNVLGEIGDPMTSIFSASLLEPCLSRTIEKYRLVVAEVDRESRRARFRAARLSGSKLAAEEILADEEIPLGNDFDFGETLARFFPETAEATEPRLYAGADLGSEKDPTEIIVARVDGPRWTDLFRLNLCNATWETQVAVFAALDCASHHRVRWGLDAGSAGIFLAQRLASRDFEVCPKCRRDTHLSERVSAFNFGEVVDEVDPDTGEPVTDPDKRDAAGRPQARRLSRKEASTRILEARVQKRNLVLADDDGAGDARLGVSALMRGVSQIGITSRGERRFDGRNDHHADARRQLALAIAKDAKDGFGGGGWVPADPALVAGTPRNGATANLFREHDTTREAGYTPAAYAVYTDELEAGELFDGRGSVGGGFGDGW